MKLPKSRQQHCLNAEPAVVSSLCFRPGATGAEGVRRSLCCPSAGEGDHPGGHAVCGRMAWRRKVCMGTCLRWCGTGIGSPRPRATSPCNFPPLIDRSRYREVASIERSGRRSAVMASAEALAITGCKRPRASRSCTGTARSTGSDPSGCRRPGYMPDRRRGLRSLAAS